MPEVIKTSTLTTLSFGNRWDQLDQLDFEVENKDFDIIVRTWVPRDEVRAIRDHLNVLLEQL